MLLLVGDVGQSLQAVKQIIKGPNFDPLSIWNSKHQTFASLHTHTNLKDL